MHSTDQEKLERICHEMEADTRITVQWRLPDGSEASVWNDNESGFRVAEG